jgi:hypothetical protein
VAEEVPEHIPVLPVSQLQAVLAVGEQVEHMQIPVRRVIPLLLLRVKEIMAVQAVALQLQMEVAAVAEPAVQAAMDLAQLAERAAQARIVHIMELRQHTQLEAQEVATVVLD